MNVYEMEGFLRGKCLPGDLKVNESNAEYLVRKLRAVSELQGEVTALVATLGKSREVSGCPEGIDLQDWVKMLAAENKRLNDVAQGGAFVMQKALMKYEFGVGMTMQAEDFIRDAREKHPATDRIVAGIKADGVAEFADRLQKHLDEGDFSANEVGVIAGAIHCGREMAQQLREGADK